MADENKTTVAEKVTDAAEDTKDRAVRSSPPEGWPLEPLSLASITRDKKFQARVRMSEEHVTNLQEVVRSGKPFHGRPMIVYRVKVKGEDGKKDTTDLILADGFQRFEALEREGKKRYEFEVREGTKTDALRTALGANFDHGLPRTTADKERAIQMALEDEELGVASNLTISRVCQVSQALVARVREAWEKENKLSVTKRRGADNKLRPTKRKTSQSVQDRKATREAVDRLASSTADPTKLARPRKGLVDEVGQDVPDNLAQVFAARVNIRGILQILSNAAVQIKALRGAGALVWGPATIETNLQTVIDDLNAATPHAVCPDCEGDGCKECAFQGKKAHGFFSLGWFVGLSKADQKVFLAKVEEAKKEKASPEPSAAGDVGATTTEVAAA